MRKTAENLVTIFQVESEHFLSRSAKKGPDQQHWFTLNDNFISAKVVVVAGLAILRNFTTVF